MKNAHRLSSWRLATLILASLAGCLCLLGLARERTAEAKISERKIAPAQAEQPASLPGKVILIERRQSPQANACVECHRLASPGIHVDWTRSRHAHAGVTCLGCHAAGPGPSPEGDIRGVQARGCLRRLRARLELLRPTGRVASRR